MKQITAYKCGFCGKKYENAKVCITHEKFCYKNPNNWHTCYDCAYLNVAGGHNDEETGEYIPKTFRCIKLHQSMFTYKAEKLKLSNIKGCVRMPLQCEHKKHVGESLLDEDYFKSESQMSDADIMRIINNAQNY